MECGEFSKRNEEYYKQFSKELYFCKLLNINNMSGEGKIIFDVGAHSGESAIFFNQMFPKAKQYSFEPIPEMAEKIRQLDLDNHLLEQCALSDFDGVEDFYIQDITHLSSLHKINKESKQSLGYHRKEQHKVVKVNVLRGDTFIKENQISKIDLLKIDVQANEIKTLKGFSNQ